MYTGKQFFFELIFVPKFFIGLVTLEKSLLERLLSPIIVILFLDLAQSPISNLPNVPEFPALIVIFFLYQMNLSQTHIFYIYFFFYYNLSQVFLLP